MKGSSCGVFPFFGNNNYYVEWKLVRVGGAEHVVLTNLKFSMWLKLRLRDGQRNWQILTSSKYWVTHLQMTPPYTITLPSSNCIVGHMQYSVNRLLAVLHTRSCLRNADKNARHVCRNNTELYYSTV